MKRNPLTHRRLHKVHERLDDGVVGGVHVGVEGEGALAVAVERLVVVGRDDPLLPTEVLEAHPAMRRMWRIERTSAFFCLSFGWFTPSGFCLSSSANPSKLTKQLETLWNFQNKLDKTYSLTT